MRGESMKGKSKKSTYSTTFGVDPTFGIDPTYSTTFGIDPAIPQPLVLTQKNAVETAFISGAP